MKFKAAVIGLKIGEAWARAALALPEVELVMVYDKYYEENETINKALFAAHRIPVAAAEEDIYHSDADFVVVASPDHFHTEQVLKALDAGKHVICEKPLAPTLAECRQIVAAVRQAGRTFMTGQVCRYAPGFKLAHQLILAGHIGEIACLESEYAHDYRLAPGYRNWRRDPASQRYSFLGGGCHALDLTRYLAGDPVEVFAYFNHKLQPDWPLPDTGIAVARFPNGVIGRVLVSSGAKRPYSMRTVIYGTRGTIICDNTSDHLLLCEEALCETPEKLQFATVPISVSSHNIQAELADFVDALSHRRPCPTDAAEGARTVAFAEAAIRSARSGRAEAVEIIEIPGEPAQ